MILSVAATEVHVCTDVAGRRVFLPVVQDKRCRKQLRVRNNGNSNIYP